METMRIKTTELKRVLFTSFGTPTIATVRNQPNSRSAQRIKKQRNLKRRFEQRNTLTNETNTYRIVSSVVKMPERSRCPLTGALQKYRGSLALKIQGLFNSRPSLQLLGLRYLLSSSLNATIILHTPILAEVRFFFGQRCWPA